MRLTPQAWFYLIALSLLWGGAFFFAAVAVKDLPPLTVVALRTGIAAPVLVIILLAMGKRPVFSGPVIGAFFIMGFLNNLVPFSLLFWAQTLIPSGLASILNATTPIFAVVIAHVALADERLTAKKAAGVAIGFVGVIVLLAPDIGSDTDVAVWGMVACLGAAVSYGFAGAFGRRFKGSGLGSVQVAFGQLAATTVMMLPVIAIVDQPWTLAMPGTAAIGSVVGLAVLSTALAYILFFRILEIAGAVNVMLVTLLIPPSAILLGVLVLDEVLAAHHYGGMALIAAGLIAIDGRWRAVMRWA